MSKHDQAGRDAGSIDRLAAAYLDATRSVEAMPPAVIHEVWERLERGLDERSDADSARAGVEEDRDARSYQRGWLFAVAAGVAAALLIGLTLSPWDSRRSSHEDGAAAVYQADALEEQQTTRTARDVERASQATSSSSTSPPPPPPPSRAVTSEPPVAATASTTEPRNNAEPKTARRLRTQRQEQVKSAKEDHAASLERDAPAPETPATSLVAETRALAKVREALASRRPARALQLLERYSSEFPRGFLVEESAALRVVALCRAGQELAGRAAAGAFYKRYPGSALTARVASACASASP